MDFGEALEELRHSKRIRREGWRRKGMCIYLEEYLKFSYINWETGRTQYVKCEPCIVSVTANGKYQPGWCPSQADLFAYDWEIVPLDEKQ